MNQQIVTYGIGLAVVVVLAVSYLRFKRHEEDGGHEPSVSIKKTLSEVQEYFGMSSKDEGDRFARALDLGPMKMLAGMFSPEDKKEPVKNEEKG